MANIGAKIVKDVNSVISYTGGNGGSYVGQTIASTGVLGLTATLQGGVFAVGVSSVTYQISGVPASAGTAIFKVNLAGKTCEIQLSVRGISYGQNINDIEGNTYKTVYIGTQQWMAENLKVSKYNDGSSIPNITDNTEWSQLTTGAWAYSNNDAANNAKYGNLYNWYAVSPTTNGNKNVCPTGWHVPTDDEWTVLTDYLGGANVAGGKMKEVGTTSWNSPNKDATNTSLFTGLPGGFRNPGGSYFGIGSSGNWWSSSENSTGNAWPRNLSSLNGNASRIYYGDNGSKIYGLSVRCVKDPIALLDCGTITNNGTLTAYSASSGVSSEIVYTGGYGSSYNGHTVLSTGVTGLTATLTSGVFEYGTGSLKYVISGTPVSQGKADFAINIGGKTCTLSRNVVLPVGHIDSLNCKTAINKGTLTVSSAANNVNSVLYYLGGNGGSLKEININSTGVNGLSARLTADTLKIGYGEFKVEILGKPTSIGIANFLIEIGGESCNLSRIILPIGLVDTLDCNKISSNGILMANYEAVNVSNTLNYTGGNGGSYNSQYINSKGVLGLVATLNEDVFSKGKGVLTYSITGVPDSIGTAVFEINIGGKTCSIMRVVGGQGENIIDIDGNNYKTVYIGTQRWMAENLTVSKFNDGTDIAIGHDIYKQWSSLTNGAWCYYDYYFNKNEINDAKYGKLYNWYAVSSTTNGNKNLCPTGWHVPSVTEFILLKDYLGGEIVAGGKMKEVGTTSWIKSNSDASNISLFTGLPGGFRAENGYFEGIGSIGFWWLSNPVGNPVNDAMFFSLNDDAYVLVMTYSRARGFSVRCLED